MRLIKRRRKLSKKKLNKIAKLYTELVMSVSRYFENETRHETALRYIRQAESDQNNSPQTNYEGQLNGR